MLIKHETPHGSWRGRRTFVLASAGATIGLANFWRFPYAMAEHGGLWFLLTYAGFLLLFALPLLYAEMLLGRMGRSSPMGSMRLLVDDYGTNVRWRWIGILGTGAGLLTLALYSVVSGMTLSYVFKAAFGEFANALPATVNQSLTQLRNDPPQMLAWELLFLVGVLTILARGVNRGIERAARYLMPLFLLILGALLIYAVRQGDVEAARIYLYGDASQSYTWRSPLYAAQHAFFTLGIGMGAMMAYGAYSPGRRGLLSTVSWVVGLDLLVSVVAGLMIFPLVFAAGLGPAQGFDLMFLVIPLTFGQLPVGQFLAAMFFVLMTLAAWGSAIALGEPLVARLVERFRLSRRAACWIVLFVVAVLALGLTLSLGELGDGRWMGVSWFSLYEVLVAGLLIPATALLIALFVGRVLNEQTLREAVTEFEPLWFYRLWRILIRFVAPPLIVLLMGMALVGFVRSACDAAQTAEGGLCGSAAFQPESTLETAPLPERDLPLANDLPPEMRAEEGVDVLPPLEDLSEDRDDQDH